MGRRRWRRVDDELRREVIRLAAKGLTRDQILAEVDTSAGSVGNVLRPLGGVFRPEMWSCSGFRLSLEERVEIYLGIQLGETLTAVADRLGRAPSTVCREVAANGGRVRYRPFVAHRRAWHHSRRPKQAKLACRRLRDRVAGDLERLWSPWQIARRLRSEFPDDPEMWVSHETIYKTLYIQGRGELRRELARCLRSGRAKRRPRGRDGRSGHIKGMVMISERPAEAGDRAVPGHWEGDLIIGKDCKSAVGTLVERTTRYVLLLHLPGGRDAHLVEQAMREAIGTLPAELARTITWDQGIEMAYNADFTIATGIPVYFCDPHSPWQRGSNENTNGLLRQYFPKRTEISHYTQADLDAVAAELNGRPRQTLGFKTPSQTLDEALR